MTDAPTEVQPVARPEAQNDQPARRGRALVITASHRAAIGVYADRSGPVLVEGLQALDFEVSGPVVVPDGDPVGEALRSGLDLGYDVILTTGGTGLSPTDLTPEVTRPLLEREVPGIAEAIRAAGVAKGVPASMLSRGLAGASGRTLVVNLPGSRGGCRDALEVLDQILWHAVEQLRGADHEVSGECPVPPPGPESGS